MPVRLHNPVYAVDLYTRSLQTSLKTCHGVFRHVQQLMRERAEDLAQRLREADSHFYVCGLKAMEDGVIETLRDVAVQCGLDWPALASTLKRDGRLHLETY